MSRTLPLARRLPAFLQFRLLARLGRMEWHNARREHRPRLWAQGFFSDRAGLYPFDRFPHELFLNDWEIEGRLGRINPVAALPALGDKLLFHLLLEQLAVPVLRPVLAGIALDGHFTPSGPFATWAEAVAEPLIAKPIEGSGGKGVMRLECGGKIPAAGNLLVERFIAPHPYASAIFPGAVNTVRVMTARNAEDGAPFILGTAHRFGTARSAPTDNRKQGGIISAIDRERGTLSAAIGLGPANERVVHQIHPDTGERIEGVAIPHWQALKDAALMLARAFPHLVLVGWDFAVTRAGPLVIEGNAGLPNPNLMQAHEPLLKDAPARQFLEHHGVITSARARRAAALAGG